jgi:hypothetical protein
MEKQPTGPRKKTSAEESQGALSFGARQELSTSHERTDFAGGSSVRPSASPTGAKAQKCYQAFTARLKSCPDTKPGLCSLRRVLRSALAAGRGNCRSLGFARDDKGGRSFRPHGCGGENCRSLGYERPFSDSLILDVWPLYQPEPRTIARLTE